VIEVENRFHHTQLDALQVAARIAGGSRQVHALPAIAPGHGGSLKIPLPEGAKTGDTLLLDFIGPDGEAVVTWGVYLESEPQPQALFEARAGAPTIEAHDTGWIIRTNRTRYEVDAASGRLSGGPFRDRPYPHFTQKELKNWFVPKEPEYLQLPDTSSVEIKKVTVEPQGDHVALRIEESYREFKGTLVVRIDQSDTVMVESSYDFTGEKARGIREAGLRLPLQAGFETIEWSRRGYWNHYPEEHLGRLSGTAEARNPATADLKMSPKFDVPKEKPSEPWTQDPSRFGTRDFRASKLNFNWATLRSEAHTIDFRGGHERHIRPALSPEGVDAFINMDDPAATLKPGKHHQASLNLRFQ
jgi:hypothetical protein